MDKFWNDLIYTVCDGKPSEMAALKKYDDIIDFFNYIENKSKK